MLLTSSTERWIRARAPLLVLALLLCLGAANVASRATWHEVEDGVLWTDKDGSVVAADIAPGTPAERVGLKRGDVLLAIDNEPVVQVDDVVEALHGARRGATLHYTIVRLGTASQPVEVHVRLAEGQARVEVCDHGPGLTPEQQAMVFESFYRSDESRTMPGSGLGLSIVRQVTERHPGTVRVDETESGGTHMVMQLPGAELVAG